LHFIQALLMSSLIEKMDKKDARGLLVDGMSVNDEQEEPKIRPSYKDMFKPRLIQALLKDVLKDRLIGKKYSQTETGTWTKEIASQIKTKLKELELKRYKFLVQVVIGEMKGAGVRMGCRCLWDSQTDKLAEETYINDSLFCVAVAFGVYLY